MISNKSAAILGVLLAIGLIVAALILGDAAVSIKSLERSVTVKGLSEREVSADTVIWPIKFKVADNSVEALYQMIQKNNAAIIAFLNKQGLDKGEITINPPTVNDLFALNYSNTNQIKFRFTGSSTLTVFSSKIDTVRKAMAQTIELGKQGIVMSEQDYQNKTRFIYNGLNDIKPAMIEEATKNAREVAQKFAADSNSKLGKIKTARQGQFSINDRDATTPHIKKVRIVSTVEYYLSD